MAIVQLGTSTSSNIVGVRNAQTANRQQFGAVSALQVIEPLTAIPALENLLARSYTTVGRVATAQNRVEQPMVRWSLQEMHDILDSAAVEVSTRVRAEFLKGLQTTESPTSNAFTISDKLRVLGSRVKIGSAIAKRIGVYRFRDLTSRGITFADTEPIFTFAGGELRVYGDAASGDTEKFLGPNPDDAEATFIRLPETTARSSAGGTFDGTTGFVAASSVFVSERDTFIPILLDDGVDTAWAYISSVTNGTTIVLGTFESLSAISTGAGAVTVTWTTPAFYQLSKVLEKLVLYLAAYDMLTGGMREFELGNEYLRSYNLMLRDWALPVFGLPLEKDDNE